MIYISLQKKTLNERMRTACHKQKKYVFKPCMKNILTASKNCKILNSPLSKLPNATFPDGNPTESFWKLLFN